MLLNALTCIDGLFGTFSVSAVKTLEMSTVIVGKNVAPV